jgi:hypothetical protein
MADGNKAITPEGLNRILKAVGKEHCPPNIDRDALARGLDQCIEWYEESKRLSTNKYLASQKRQLRTIRDRAKRLQQLMKDDDLWDDKLWQHRADRADPRQLTPRLAAHSIVSMVDRKLVERGFDLQDQYYQLTFWMHNPFELLFGDWLPVLYNATGFRGGTSLKLLASKIGPYMRFAQLVAKELFRIKVLGRRYAAGSFIKAVNNVAAPPISRRRIRFDDPGDSEFFEWAAEDRRDELRSIVASKEGSRWAKVN